MCGIVGVAGAITNREKKAFQDMLIFSQVRGEHSTGVASVAAGNTGQTFMCKTLGRPDQMIDYDKRYDKVVDYGRKFMLGHNRYATTGKISLKNAHPFNFENIVGCHNGTIPEYRLKELKKDPDLYGTDSETVLANVNEYPLKDVFKRLGGAWAFVWHDRRDNSLNFYRNDQRDLFYCYTKDRKTLFWASEAGFLKAALARNGIEMGEMFDVTPDFHHSWEIPDYNKEFKKPVKMQIHSNQWEAPSGNRFPGTKQTGEVGESKQGAGPNSGTDQSRLNPPHTSGVPRVGGANVTDINKWKNHGGATASGYDRQFIGAPGGAVAEIIVPKIKDFESYANLKNFDGQGYLSKGRDKRVYRGFRGETLNKAQWEEATKAGCGWCDTQAQWGRPVRFVDTDTHICLECNSDSSVLEIYGKSA